MTRRCCIDLIVIASLMGLLLPRMVHAEWIALDTAHVLPADPSLILERFAMECTAPGFPLARE